MSEPLQIWLLGEPGVGPLRTPLPPDRSSEVLILLAAAKQALDVTDLIASLWPDDDPPEKAKGVVQQWIRRLRRFLEAEGFPDAIPESRVGRYRLLANSDLALARALRAQAVDEGARRVQVEAASARGLALWQGESLEGFADRPAVAEIAQRADALRTDLFIRWGMSAGRTILSEPKLGDVLESVARKRIGDESLVAAAMRVAYLRGRRASSEDLFEAARRVARQGFGADPGPDLARMHQRILIGDPSLDTRPPPNMPNPPKAAGRLIGRTEAIATTLDVLGPGRVVTLIGPLGIGKTRLAIEVAEASGLEVVWLDTSGIPASGLVEHVAATAGLPGMSLEDLRHRVDAHDHLFVVDDLTPEGARVLAALDLRDAKVLATALRPTGARSEVVLSIGPLGDRAAELFIDRVAASRPSAIDEPGLRSAAEVLVDRLGGHPLAIETAARLAEALPIPEVVRAIAEGRWSGAGDQIGFRALIAGSVSALSASARAFLQAAARLPASGSLDAIRALAGLPDSWRDVDEVLATGHLLGPDDRGRYRVPRAIADALLEIEGEVVDRPARVDAMWDVVNAQLLELFGAPGRHDEAVRLAMLELPNALGCAPLVASSPTVAWNIARVLLPVLRSGGRFSERDELLASVRDVLGEDDPRVLHEAAASAYFVRQDGAEALALAARAFEANQASGNPFRAWNAITAGLAANACYRPEEALRYADAAEAAFAEQGDVNGVGQVATIRALAAVELRRDDDAIAMAAVSAAAAAARGHLLDAALIRLVPIDVALARRAANEAADRLAELEEELSGLDPQELRHVEHELAYRVGVFGVLEGESDLSERAVERLLGFRTQGPRVEVRAMRLAAADASLRGDPVPAVFFAAVAAQRWSRGFTRIDREILAPLITDAYGRVSDDTRAAIVAAGRATAAAGGTSAWLAGNELRRQRREIDQIT